MRRTGPRTGAQKERSRLNKFRAFFHNFLINFGLMQRFLSFKSTFLERLMLILIYFTFSLENLGKMLITKKFVVLDLFSIRFSPNSAILKAGSSKICRGRSKPLYEAPDFNCNQIGQSGHQSEDNFIPKSNLVSIQFNFQ